MLDAQRWRASLTAGIIAAILLTAAAYYLAGELIFAPRFASPDASEVVRAYFTARQWGYRGLSERALAPEAREQLRAPNAVHPPIDDVFLACDLVVSAPLETPLYGEYAEELLFVVTYRSRWREVTGAPPGPRGWFVYAGRDVGGAWQILGQGTGP
jgi:hypothetical protein